MILTLILLSVVIIVLSIFQYKTNKKLSKLEKVLKEETPRLFIEKGEAKIYTQDGKTKLTEFKINK